MVGVRSSERIVNLKHKRFEGRGYENKGEVMTNMRVRFNLIRRFCRSHLLVRRMGAQTRSNYRAGRGFDAIVAIRNRALRTIEFHEMAHRDNVIRREANIDGLGTLIE